jgi:hypothetical protein
MRKVVALGALAFATVTACSLLTPLDGLRGDAGACETGTQCGATCVDTSTDGHNCGACGHDCLGAGCNASACLPITLATSQDSPFGIAVDPQRVYWANNDWDSSFASCAITGCVEAGVTTLLSGRTLPADVFLANGHIYMTEYGWPDAGPGGILACNPTDCAATLVTLATEPAQNPVAIVADSTAVYWANANAGRIDTCSTGGCGSPSTLAKDRSGGPWYGLALAAGTLYWTSKVSDAGAVLSCATGGCTTPTTIAASAGAPWDLAVDASYVYWTTAEGGQVLRCPVAGCGNSAPLVIADNQALPAGIAVDSSGVYWLNQQSGAVLRCDTSGCGANGPQVLATGQNQPWEIVLDATSIYWTNAGTNHDGSIMRLAKP